MDTELLAVIAIVVYALLIWTPTVWKKRTYAIIGALLMEILAVALVVVSHPGTVAILFVLLSGYKLFNYARILKARMQPDYLWRATRKTGLWLTAMQVVLAVVAMTFSSMWWSGTATFAAVAVQLFVTTILVASTARHLRTTKTLQATTSYTDAALPSISVLIPARNETDDLHECLSQLIASNYPKLEIIVLDDCSQDKRTPEIIRGFAHDGVRFIAGQAPGDSWLAKNYAYQQLADAASGDYLVFIGVDVRMEVGALRELITTMLEKKKTMLSILPHNAKPYDRKTYLIQPMRYAWELSLPRRLFNRPPVLSTCWIITRAALEAAGSFKAVSRTITPESYFARSAARTDGYSFLRSNMLVSNKPAVEQRDTAIRTRYPQLHRRPELVVLVAATELVALTLPLPLAVALALASNWLLTSFVIVAFVMQYALYLQVTGVMYGRSVVRGVITVPLLAAYDIWILHHSMYKYEFSEVHWKDRNVCLPVMRLDGVATGSGQPKDSE